ncbi:putative bifunctional diguanylate cyclase/phosphodiesterase [Octadecabacter temperatus]|nr:bifunctional diguanylate cyclase/phosphodiesterase [Octadecabacter temperatus]
MHYAAITHLATRDYPLQSVTVLFLCAVCHYLGHTTLAVFTAVWLVISKVCAYFVCKRQSPFDQLPKDWALLALMALFFVNAILYVVPALVLASDPSIAMKLSAVLWVIGAQVYVTNTWSGVPTFVYTMLLPIMLLMVIVFLRLGSTVPVASTLSHWIVTFAFVGLFIYTSIDTLRGHLATEAALKNAERTATSRLLQLEEAQRIDGLTGLLNRPAFDVALQIMLEDRAHGNGEVAVFLVDLDSFKPINDTYSHEAGDRVLMETATRLQKHIGDLGIVGRLGGDEFILAIQIDNGVDALGIAETLYQNIALPVLWTQHMLKVTASIGVSTTGANLRTVPALCSAADQAMFAAKSSPNRAPVLYEEQLFTPRLSSDEKQALVDSIANETVKPYYQPKIHLPTGDIIGFEALARWEHPNNTLRLPCDFLRQINDLGLQGDFMISIASQVFRDVEAMLEHGLDPGQVSLNIPEVALATYSGRQDLHRIVAARPACAKHVTFEITEDVFIARAADMIQASIASFRDLGLRISLDDFGTGFASFDHLRQLDFDELKIDTSFVSDLGQDNTADVLVRGFLDIASGLGVSAIAEGVETEAQRQHLANMGCLIAQGYLFSAALPFDEATALLTTNRLIKPAVT